MDLSEALPLVFWLVVGCVAGYSIGFRRGKAHVTKKMRIALTSALKRDRRVTVLHSTNPEASAEHPRFIRGVASSDATTHLPKLPRDDAWDGFPTERA